MEWIPLWIGIGWMNFNRRHKNLSGILVRYIRRHRGLYFALKTIFIPPPFWKWCFPLSPFVIFLLLLWPFSLNSSLFHIYFPLLLPLFLLSSPFFHFLSPFLLFLLHFPLFSLPLFVFYIPKWKLADISLGGGGRYFPIYRPWEETVGE